MQRDYDVVIVGGGIVGLTAALLLAKQTSLRIALIDVKKPDIQWSPSQYDHRVSAIALSSQRIFQYLDVWSLIQAKRISPYQHMRVWDGVGKGNIAFSASSLYESALGYIVEDAVMRISLLEKMADTKNITYLAPMTLVSMTETDSVVRLITDDDQCIQTRLLIAADGAESWVRKQKKIEIVTKSYQHTAIIANVTTEKPHVDTAYQCFWPTGPVAFLPLAEQKASSIVWSVVPAYADELLALNDDAFRERLTHALEHTLGDVISVSARHAFPLHMRHAKQYVTHRVAFIGDAAHTVHPLAGQGVNMGLLDAAALAEVIAAAHHKKRDIGHLTTLRRYERWRKSDTFAMLAMVDGLKRLFASENKLIMCLRSVGLNMTNQLGFLKQSIAKYALGQRDDVPRAAR